MNDNQSLFERQSGWQRDRVCLSWPDKIRMAETVQETLRRFRSLATEQARREKGGFEGDPAHRPEP
jgi:hypothetical protein